MAMLGQALTDAIALPPTAPLDAAVRTYVRSAHATRLVRLDRSIDAARLSHLSSLVHSPSLPPSLPLPFTQSTNLKK